MAFIIRIDARRCKSCELCVAACPKKIMLISDRKNELGFRIAACGDESACTGCAACGQVCPDAAIEIVKTEGDVITPRKTAEHADGRRIPPGALHGKEASV